MLIHLFPLLRHKHIDVFPKLDAGQEPQHEGGVERTVLTLPFRAVGHRTSKQSLFRCHLIQPLNVIDEEAEAQRREGKPDGPSPSPGAGFC